MADFTSDFHSLRPSLSYLNIDPHMDLMSQFAEPNQPVIENPTFNLQNFMSLTSDNCLISHQQPFQIPGNYYWTENIPGIVHQDDAAVPIVHPTRSEFQESKKRIGVGAADLSGTSSGNSSAQVSQSGVKRKISYGRGKRAKGNGKEQEKPKDVVHVRARRGQATDSHSLAERVRRGKINEKLRCLQDIIPGCYKTMGMAVLLDEIINYVHSLQNQVEFLSMKLTAASAYYDFNSETDDIETTQRTREKEGKEGERLIREGYGGLASFNSTWPF